MCNATTSNIFQDFPCEILYNFPAWEYIYFCVLNSPVCISFHQAAGLELSLVESQLVNQNLKEFKSLNGFPFLGISARKRHFDGLRWYIVSFFLQLLFSLPLYSSSPSHLPLLFLFLPLSFLISLFFSLLPPPLTLALTISLYLSPLSPAFLNHFDICQISWPY